MTPFSSYDDPLPLPEPETCAAQAQRGSIDQCDQPPIQGSEFCLWHDPDAQLDRAEEIYR